MKNILHITALVNSYFKNEEKTTLWLNTDNPLLGNQIPIQMIFAGRTEKLEKFIRNQLEENEL